MDTWLDTKSMVDSNWGLSECTMKIGIEKII